MDWKTLKRLFTDLSDMIKSKNIMSFAGSAAFFFVLSMIPMMMTMCSLLPFTSIGLEELTAAIVSVLPGFARGIMVMLIADAYYESVSLISFSALIAVWSGAMGMMALIKGVNVMNGIEDKRNYFHVRLLAALYTVAFLVIILLIILITVFTRLIKNFIEDLSPSVTPFIEFLLNFRLIILFLILTFVFSLVYRFLPAKRVSYRSQLPGSVISSLGWSVLSVFFSIYFENFGGFSIYGTAASIIVVMMWLYACMYMFFVGAFINKFIAEKSYKPFLDAIN